MTEDEARAAYLMVCAGVVYLDHLGLTREADYTDNGGRRVVVLQHDDGDLFVIHDYKATGAPGVFVFPVQRVVETKYVIKGSNYVVA